MTNPNDAVIAEFHAKSGSVTQAMGGALAGLDLALIHHRGRHSGQAYITPVAYMPYSGDYLLLGSLPAHPPSRSGSPTSRTALRSPWRQAPARRP